MEHCNEINTVTLDVTAYLLVMDFCCAFCSALFNCRTTRSSWCRTRSMESCIFLFRVRYFD